MGVIEAKITQFREKMERCQTMTDLLIVMSSWQSFCNNNAIDQECKSMVDEAYLKAEERLMSKVKKSLW